jgi:predicted helicase
MDAKNGKESDVIFELYSCGVKSNRDEWVYDFNKQNLETKIQFFIETYNTCLSSSKKDPYDLRIKWADGLIQELVRNNRLVVDKQNIVDGLYRPYCKMKMYYSKELFERRYQMTSIFPDNKVIGISGIGSSKDYQVLAADNVPTLDFIEKSQCLPLYRYESGRRVDNITDWALEEFRTHYGDTSITKEDIFHYVYAVLHNPAYRKKYEIDLKQDYPRVPFYAEFARWRDWGKELMELHIGFETVSAYPGIEIVLAPAKAKEGKTHSAGYTKDDNGDRVFDGTVTFCDGSGLKGIPAEAFDYRLGNKSAIEWILDQYVAPSYPTDEEVLSGKRKIREDERVLRDNFNTFRFADYKDKVIDLIRRVTTVSLRTVEVQKEMEKEEGM